jgi:alpha-beta hydrolase superfamily lysophospholipase
MALRSEGADVDTTGTPVWLELGAEPIYAVLHTARLAERPRLGALILPTFGWDNDCSYRARRDWATALAESGVAVARIDFPGTENSVGSPLAANRVGSWVDATVSAAEWLRQRSGCDRVVAIGIGLGGLIAYEAAVAGAAIDDLVLWGVRASGRAYVRELRAYAAVVAGEIGDDGDTRADGAIGIGGHRMSVETAEALSAISLTAISLPDAHLRRVLLVGRDAHGVDGKLQSHLAESGAAVTVLQADDYHLLMAPPELCMRPTETISASIGWLLEPLQANLEPIRHVPAPVVPDELASVEFEYDGVRIRENLMELQTSAGRLVGIISEPTSEARAPFGLVVLNTGALRHTGPNRMFVEIARRAAADGVPVARFDFPGLGDSDGTSVKTYERRTEDDSDSLAMLGEIYDHLEAVGFADRFVATGLCLGGYLPIRAALEEKRSVGAISANAPALRWTDAQRQRLVRELIAFAGPETIVATPGRQRLPRWLRTTVDRLTSLRVAVDARARRLLGGSELLWRLEHRAGIADAARTLDQLGGTGVPMLLMFSEGEAILRILAQPKPAGRLRRWPNIEVEHLPTHDHLLRSLRVQDMFSDRVAVALRELRPRE